MRQSYSSLGPALSILRLRLFNVNEICWQGRGVSQRAGNHPPLFLVHVAAMRGSDDAKDEKF